jgi:hypothetical protein
VDGEREPGRHKIELDGSILPGSGIVVVRLEFGGGVKTRKMLMLK